jgi:hypothetical protein
MHSDVELVEQLVLQQGAHQREAPVNQDGAVKPGDRLRGIAVQRRRIPRQRPAQRVGDDDLGDLVHRLGVRPGVARPGPLKNLVGAAAEQEDVAGQNLFGGLLAGLVVEVPLRPPAVLGLAEMSRVLDNPIKRHQRRRDDRAHSHSPSQVPGHPGPQQGRPGPARKGIGSHPGAGRGYAAFRPAHRARAWLDPRVLANRIKQRSKAVDLPATRWLVVRKRPAVDGGDRVAGGVEAHGQGLVSGSPACSSASARVRANARRSRTSKSGFSMAAK